MESIMAQTLEDWELIICDSMSDDGSQEYFNTFRSDPRVHLHSVARDGLYAGWNECLRRARGKYVYIATSDDTASPNLLERLTAALETHQDHELALCGCQEIDENGLPTQRAPARYDQFLNEVLEVGAVSLPGKAEFSLMALFGPTWGSMTRLLIRRSLLDRTGLFPSHHGTSGDWAWALRTVMETDVVHLPETLATWRRHPGQASASWTTLGHRSYHRILDEALRLHWPRLSKQWGWGPKELGILSEVMWSRYEEDCGWYLYMAKRTPLAFLRAGLDIWKQDRGLFWRRCSNGFRLPSRDRFKTSAVKSMLNDLHCSWPPRRLGLPGVSLPGVNL
jgi:glycosyltransferase involved in cell wall biosynthesis